MTRKSTIAERTRICPVCMEKFLVPKPSTKQRCCSHSCAFSVIGDKVRAASCTPEAIAKRSDAQRDRGAGKWYRKVNGRHEHRTVGEQKIGRPLLSGEVVHHMDETKRNNDPDNLEVMTRPEHSRLHMLGKKRPPKMACKFGHPLTPENTKLTNKGRRRCVICCRKRDREYQARKRAEHAHN